MTEAANVTTTIMFADVCDSTYLFSELGDEKAFELINETLRRAADIVRQHHGVVLRTKGDDVLCTFSDPLNALEAAISIQARRPTPHTAWPPMAVGINSGPAILSGGDVLGDTVNVAARLSSFAKAGQTLISENTANLLSGVTDATIRHFGDITLKGKSHPVSTYEVLGDADEDDITQVGQTPLNFSKSNRLSLRFQSRKFELNYLLNRFTLGRSPNCDLVLDHPLVSRHHAEIRYEQSEFVLHDFSTNGTHLVLAGRPLTLHHKGAALRGSGSIVLGRTAYNQNFEITFQASGGSRRY